MGLAILFCTLSSVKFKNEWSYTSCSPVCLAGVYGVTFFLCEIFRQSFSWILLSFLGSVKRLRSVGRIYSIDVSYCERNNQWWLCGLPLQEQWKHCSKNSYQTHLSLYILVQNCIYFAYISYSCIVSFWFVLTFILPSNNQNQANSKNLG